MLQVVLSWVAAWLLAALILQFARRSAAARRYWADRGVPHLPPCPVFGSLRDVILLRTTSEEAIAEQYYKFPNEQFVGFWRMHSPALLVRDPALARTMFIADFDNFSHRGVVVDERADPLTAHLINLSGARWRHLRSRLTAFSSTGRLRAMVPAVSRCAVAAEEVLRGHQGRPVNADEVLARCVRRRERAKTAAALKNKKDVIGACVFGLDFSALATPEASLLRAYGRRAARVSFSMSIRRGVRLLLPKIAHALRVRQFPADMCDFFRTLVTSELDRREHLMSECGEGQQTRQRADLMQLLLEIRQDIRNANMELYDNSPKIKDEDFSRGKKKPKEYGDVSIEDAALSEDLLAAQAFVFFLAGFESPSNTGTFCLYELARHPRVQQAAREDVLRAIRAHPSSNVTSEGPCYEALQDMTYLDLVIFETLRRYPSSGTLFRECERHYRVPGSSLTLEPGTMVFINIFAMHHDPQYFADPYLFRPERFSPQERAKIVPYTYLPFGLGPRTCVGERFSYLQMKMILARVLMNFEVQPCPETPQKLFFDPRAFGLRSNKPIALRFLSLPPHSATVAGNGDFVPATIPVAAAC